MRLIQLITPLFLMVVMSAGCNSISDHTVSADREGTDLYQHLINKKTLELESMKMLALDKLNEKYCEDFELVDMGNSAWGTSSKWRFKPIDGDEDTVFDFSFYKNKDGSYETRDGYYCVLAREEYTQCVREIVSKEFGKFILKVSIPADALLGDELRKGISIRDAFVYKEKNIIDICGDIVVVANEEIDYDKKAARVFDAVDAIKIISYIDFYVVDDDTFESASLDSLEFSNDAVLYHKQR
jgi:hypothetical protein